MKTVPTKGVPTNDEIKAAVQVMVAVAETIKELGQVPSGHLYAQVMNLISIDSYHRIIDRPKGAGLIKEQNHLLIWTGDANSPIA